MNLEKSWLSFYGDYCCLVLSHVRLLVTPWTAAQQAPLSMGFPRQESWSGLTFLLQGMDPSLPHWQVDSLPWSHQANPNRTYTAYLNDGAERACSEMEFFDHL